MPVTANTFCKLSANTGFFPASTNIGLVKSGSFLYLIDTGSSPAVAQEVLTALSTLFPDCKVKAILNTHSHSDHCGGNDYIVSQTKAEVWASYENSLIMQFPLSLSAIYWGGNIFSELAEESFAGKAASKATRILKNNEIIDLGSASIKCIPLAGHYFDQLGFLVEDKSDGKKSFFLGDGLFGLNMIKKYWIPFMFNEVVFRQSVEKIDRIPADFYIPGHGEKCESGRIHALTEINILITLETETLILKTLKKASLTHEELLEAVADFAGIDLRLGQYVLIGGTLRSYLSCLKDQGLVDFKIEDNRMLWFLKQDSLAAANSL